MVICESSKKLTAVPSALCAGLERRELSRIQPDPNAEHRRDCLQWHYSEQPLRFGDVHSEQICPYDREISDSPRHAALRAPRARATRTTARGKAASRGNSHDRTVIGHLSIVFICYRIIRTEKSRVFIKSMCNTAVGNENCI